MQPRDLYSTWTEIDLSALRNNIQILRRGTGVDLMAVVKANAYGHGAAHCARAALDAGAAWLAVARLEEALELRNAGIDTPILLLGYTPHRRFDEAIARDISLTVWDYDQVEVAEAASERTGKPALLHLKVDTGMSRLGVQVKDAFLLASFIHAAKNATLQGIFTHFACADETNRTSTDTQEALFDELISAAKAAGIQPAWIHASNSAATLNRPKAHYNLTRTGIAMYGLSPSTECPLLPSFRPVMSWKAVISQVKTLPPGRGISYGHSYKTEKQERVGTLPVGYADGFRRIAGNSALIKGKRVPVLGRVCMDQCVISLQGMRGAREGEEVVLIGNQGNEVITAEEIASRWGTINYEVTCGVAARVPRIYLP